MSHRILLKTIIAAAAILGTLGASPSSARDHRPALVALESPLDECGWQMWEDDEDVSYELADVCMDDEPDLSYLVGRRGTGSLFRGGPPGRAFSPGWPRRGAIIDAGLEQQASPLS